MQDILDMLVQEIERGAFPIFFAKSEYRRDQHDALEHSHWLEEHLSGEEKFHLEQVHAADVRLETLEREAIIRTALAIGIRLALSC